MASMASSSPRTHLNSSFKSSIISRKTPTHVITSQNQQQKPPPLPPLKKGTDQVTRREVILRSSEFAMLGAIFHFSGKKPEYLGVQKNPPALALCPATNNCLSTSENISDLTHYAPPWNYNPEGRGSKNPVSREVAVKELLQVIKSTKPDNYTPQIVEKKDDYIRVEYESPILGFIDDVEFWFPQGKKPLVQYRTASRIGSFDFFDINRKRIKALRVALEKKGWASEDSL